MPSRTMMTSNGRQMRPDSVNPGMPDEIIAMIEFSAQGTTEEPLQKAYRNLMCIGLVPVVLMVIEID